MVHHDHMASAQDLFGQLWKEYTLSDSRYMTSDTLVLCMETMTVVRVSNLGISIVSFFYSLTRSGSSCGDLYALSWHI